MLRKRNIKYKNGEIIKENDLIIFDFKSLNNHDEFKYHYFHSLIKKCKAKHCIFKFNIEDNQIILTSYFVDNKFNIVKHITTKDNYLINYVRNKNVFLRLKGNCDYLGSENINNMNNLFLKTFIYNLNKGI